MSLLVEHLVNSLPDIQVSWVSEEERISALEQE